MENIMAKNIKGSSPAFPRKKSRPPSTKTDISRDEIKSILGTSKFTLKEVEASDWAAYRLNVERLPEGIVTVTLGEKDRGLYDRAISVCRNHTHKGLQIIRGEV